MVVLSLAGFYRMLLRWSVPDVTQQRKKRGGQGRAERSTADLSTKKMLAISVVQMIGVTRFEDVRTGFKSVGNIYRLLKMQSKLSS